jgi:hypothetical protein
MIGVRLSGGREMRSDWRQSEVALKGDLGWVVIQERIDGYWKVG